MVSKEPNQCNSSTMKDFFEYLNSVKNADSLFINRLQSIITMKLELTVDNRNTQYNNTFQEMMIPLIECNNKEELKEKVGDLCLLFFVNINIKPKVPTSYNQIKNIIGFWEELKAKHMLKIDHLHKNINIIPMILSSFLLSFIGIFEYKEILYSNIPQLCSSIDNLVLGKTRKINSIIALINTLYHYLKEGSKDNKVSESFVNGLNKEALFQVYYQDDQYYNNITVLTNLLQLYPHETENTLAKFNQDKNTKYISRVIHKHNLQNYLKKESFDALVLESKMSAFSFYYDKYTKGEINLIAVYEIFQNESIIIDKLALKLMKSDHAKEANLIRSYKYTEEDDIALSSNENNENIIKLPFPVEQVTLISEEKDLDKLNDFFKEDYIGIDSEWKPKISMYEMDYDECAILQLASKSFIAIIDVMQLKDNAKFIAKFEEVFKGKKFIGFSFENDIKALPTSLKSFFHNKCTIIDIMSVYTQKYKTKCPDLKKLCAELFNKELNKKEQLSNWLLRPLRKRQIEYGALDAIILLSLYDIIK